MASNKIYTVVKDGEELEKLKTLTAAKKLADAEGAEVYCDDKCVYQADVDSSASTSAPETDAGEQESKETQTPQDTVEIVTVEPVVAKKPTQPAVDEPKTEKYRLKGLMNVRTKPSLDAKKAGTKPEGTVVRVKSIEGDWLCLADGNFILYESGKWAEKI